MIIRMNKMLVLLIKVVRNEQVRNKVNFTLEQAIKIQRGSRGE
jgi:hypothetical protein